VQWPLSFNLMNAQATSHIPHSPSRTVRIKRLRDEHDRFPGILDDSVFKRLYENAFVIHNGDSRDLVAAYALWTIIDQDGRLYTHEYMVDIYAALMPTSVILAGKDIIVSPNGWIFPHEYSDARRAFDAQSINLLDSRLTQATKISLSIDAVIFGDGETCGVNTKRLDQAIVARRDAAISLAANARDALTRGEPAVSSEDLFAQSNDKSSEAFWRGHLGGQLSREPDKEPYLRYLESLPRPPAFYASRSTD
jgi:hypothetical protein